MPVAVFITKDMEKKKGYILSSWSLQSMKFISISDTADFCARLSNMDGDISLPDLRPREIWRQRW